MATNSNGYVSITSYGAIGDGVTNNTTAIQNALNYAAANGLAVYVPAGTFAYSGTLTDNGVAFYGAGTSSILKALNGAQEALTLTGNDASVSNLQIDGTGSTRLSNPQSCAVLAYQATNYTIQNVLINGSSSGGIMSQDSSYGSVLNNTVENTLADSITSIDGSNNITITGNRILNSGDDGISIVSYVGSPIVHDITEAGNTVIGNNWGRGMSVVGGDNIQISGNNIQGGTSGDAGIYIAAESEWNTQGVANVTVNANTLINAGGAPSGTGQGAVTVYNSQGSAYAISGVTINGNQIDNPLSQAFQFVGNGVETVQVTNNTDYTSGSSLVSNGNPSAGITYSGNTMLPTSSYTTPLVASGGGVSSVPSTTGSSTGSTTVSSPTGSPDTIVFKVSGDGSPTFTAFVDGKQVGGLNTVTAPHNTGQTQSVSLTGNFGLNTAGTHTVSLQFDNPGTNTALYVASATADGNVMAGTTAVNTASAGHSDPNDAPMLSAGSLTFSETVDAFTIKAAADGNATFKFILDGRQVGGEQTVTAAHNLGQWENISIAGAFGLGSAGTNTLAIQFDDPGANTALYVGSVTENGHLMAGISGVNTASLGHTDPSDAPMLGAGTLTFKF